MTANLRLVVKIAYEYRRAYKNIMDLVQEGNIGLMQAVKRYDPYRGVKLSSYAAWWIRAYILRFILNNWRLVKLGTTQAQRKLFFNLRKKRAELAAMGIDPTDAEIAKRLNVPETDVVVKGSPRIVLIETFYHYLGPRFTPQMQEAWEEAFEMVSAEMLKGEDVLPPQEAGESQ